VVAPVEDPRDGAIDVTVNAVAGVGADGWLPPSQPAPSTAMTTAIGVSPLIQMRAAMAKPPGCGTTPLELRL
jgi:hypothetical protein